MQRVAILLNDEHYLASRAMGLALRHLPDHRQENHGYHPLLAETFTDIESFEGTRYKASNWQPCGIDLPAAYQPGCDLQTAERALPLKKAHLESLRDVLREVPDPRAGNRSWPISTLLTLICTGLLAG